MNSQTFDAITTQTAARLPRRTTLIGLGTALAALTASFPAEAKKKRKKKAKNLCKKQEGQCESAAEAICALTQDPDACLSGMLPCCGPLRSCDAESAFECLLSPLV